MCECLKEGARENMKTFHWIEDIAKRGSIGWLTIIKHGFSRDRTTYDTVASRFSSDSCSKPLRNEHSINRLICESLDGCFNSLSHSNRDNLSERLSLKTYQLKTSLFWNDARCHSDRPWHETFPASRCGNWLISRFSQLILVTKLGNGFFMTFTAYLTRLFKLRWLKANCILSGRLQNDNSVHGALLVVKKYVSWNMLTLMALLHHCTRMAELHLTIGFTW